MYPTQSGQSVVPNTPLQDPACSFAYSLYLHNQQLYQEELEQFQSHRRRSQAQRTIRRLLFAVLFLLAANLGVASWCILRIWGLLP